MKALATLCHLSYLVTSLFWFLTLQWVWSLSCCHLDLHLLKSFWYGATVCMLACQVSSGVTWTDISVLSSFYFILLFYCWFQEFCPSSFIGYVTCKCIFPVWVLCIHSAFFFNLLLVLELTEWLWEGGLGWQPSRQAQLFKYYPRKLIWSVSFLILTVAPFCSFASADLDMRFYPWFCFVLF